jgi:hypothetical protein
MIARFISHSNAFGISTPIPHIVGFRIRGPALRSLVAGVASTTETAPRCPDVAEWALHLTDLRQDHLQGDLGRLFVGHSGRHHSRKLSAWICSSNSTTPSTGPVSLAPRRSALSINAYARSSRSTNTPAAQRPDARQARNDFCVGKCSSMIHQISTRCLAVPT